MNGNFSKSNRMLEEALKLTPLGAQTFSKSYRYYCKGISPVFLDRGKGCHVWDIDGNKFTDFVCALGPMMIGYNDPRINKAVIKQLRKGVSFTLPTPRTIELAEKICKVVPCAEKVRFMKNGSDVTTAAVRLARAYTGRDRIAVCGYHGMHDWFIGATVNNKGVPRAVCELTSVFKYNDIDSLKGLFEKYRDQFAAVILEPIQGNGPEDGYLQELKNETHKHGAILIFDEVVSGFRYALGGASELYGVTPDLAAFGKGMANGFAISAVAGKKELLDQIEEGVFISTTFGDEALSMVAALETIRILEQPGSYQYIWSLGKVLLEGLGSLIKAHSLEKVVEIHGLPPHGGVVFNGSGALSYLDINSVYQQKMIERGILTVGINNISLSHTLREIRHFLASADEAFSDISKAVKQNSISGMLKGGAVDPIFKRN
jgi:glutamate-1-semialdehyde 2,1-aminomutase